MTRKFFLAAALIVTGNIAFAEVTAKSIADDLISQGYSRVELRQGPSQIKAEAIRGSEKLEVIYDMATGSVLKTSTYSVSSDEDTTPGVKVRNRNSDFMRSSDDEDDDHSSSKGSDDHGNDDSDDDHDGGSDDDSDHGSDHDSDHDSDHGGSDSGHDSNDD